MNYVVLVVSHPEWLRAMINLVLYSHKEMKNLLTFNTSPRWTKSTDMVFSDNISKSGPIVTNWASVGFKLSNFDNASEVFP